MDKTPSSECSNCGASTTSEQRWILLHHVRLRGIYRRLCTSCVLKLHPGSFCPTCFEIFESTPPYHHRVTCQKCPSISHPICVLSTEKPYTCPPCANPNFSFFNIKVTKDDAPDGSKRVQRVIDDKAAKVLLCAAKIASVSMSKAVAVARNEAEKRVKEAAVSRKRAKEALEYISVGTASSGKVKRKEVSVEVSGLGGSVPVAAKEQDRKEEAKVLVQNPIENLGGVMKASCQVSANLTSVGLREKERVQGLGSLNGGVPVPVAVVDEEERPKVTDASGVGQLESQHHGTTMSANEKSSELTNLDHNNAEAEMENNGICSVPSLGGQLQHPENSNGRSGEK